MRRNLSIRLVSTIRMLQCSLHRLCLVLIGAAQAVGLVGTVAVPLGIVEGAFKTLAEEHGVDERTIRRDGQLSEAADRIYEDQLGQRNISPDQMSLLRGRRHNWLKKAHGGQVPGTRMAQSGSSSTAKQLAGRRGLPMRVGLFTTPVLDRRRLSFYLRLWRR